MALMFSRAQASQKYWRAPFSTEQVQVTGSSSAVVPQRAQTKGSSGFRASFTLLTIVRPGPGRAATHRGGRSVRTGPRVVLSGQCMTAMASARRARSETRSARLCIRRAATRRRAWRSASASRRRSCI